MSTVLSCQPIASEKGSGALHLGAPRVDPAGSVLPHDQSMSSSSLLYLFFMIIDRYNTDDRIKCQYTPDKWGLSQILANFPPPPSTLALVPCRHHNLRVRQPPCLDEKRIPHDLARQPLENSMLTLQKIGLEQSCPTVLPRGEMATTIFPRAGVDEIERFLHTDDVIVLHGARQMARPAFGSPPGPCWWRPNSPSHTGYPPPCASSTIDGAPQREVEDYRLVGLYGRHAEEGIIYPWQNYM